MERLRNKNNFYSHLKQKNIIILDKERLNQV